MWLGLALACIGPLIGAALSPLLAWRDPIYIAAGFAGIAGFALLLVQPVLALGVLPGPSASGQRRVHRISGLCLVAAIVMHVAGLWITSPPDVVDALLLVSATPFSLWGVIAMWALFATATLALSWRRWGRRWGLRWITWSRAHRLLAGLIATTTVAHVLLIEGTMDPVTKYGLSGLVLMATVAVIAQHHIWKR